MNRAARVGAPALTIVVALGTSLVATSAGAGDATTLLLARAATRLVLDLASAAVLGVVAVVLLLPARTPGRERALDAAAVAAGVWAVAAALTAFLLYAGQAPALSSPAFGPGLVSFVADVAIGRTWLIAAIVAAVLSTALVAVRSRTGVALLLPAAAACLIPVALQSATSDQSLAAGRTTAAAALVALVAAATWIGAAAVAPAFPRSATVQRRAAGLPLVCGPAALLGVALGGLPRTPLGLAAACALVLALATVVAVRVRPARVPAAIELPLLAVAAGLATAARVLQTLPPTAPARTTPAEILTGASLPAAPSAAQLLGAWQPDAVWLLIALGLLVGYAAAVLRLRRLDVPWSTARSASWTIGVVLLLWLTSGAPVVYQQVLVSAHLAQHAALVAVVPLLLAGGAPLRLLVAATPDGSAAPSARVLLIDLLRSQAVRVLTRPATAAVLALLAVLSLYGTVLLRWSVTDPIGTEWSIVQCLVPGGLLTAAIVAGERRPATWIAVVLLVVETGLAAVPALGPGLLLADWYGAMGWGTDALADQRLGALVAWGIAVAATFALLVVAVRRPGRPPMRPEPPTEPTARLEASA